MRYGYFDDINREYVITRPDTPAPWAEAVEILEQYHRDQGAAVMN